MSSARTTKPGHTEVKAGLRDIVASADKRRWGEYAIPPSVTMGKR
jgi:hypothetical protein